MQPEINQTSGITSAQELFSQLVSAVVDIAGSLRRLADVHAPMPKDKVDSSYIADRLGCTVTYGGEMARTGRIPPNCIASGTGNGKPWKFHRKHVDTWIETR